MQSNFSNKQLMSEINVTPFVDVMLVLLIIFMVTAPMMVQGVDVNLPTASFAPLKGEDEHLVISVKKNQSIYINDQIINILFLSQKLEKIFENSKSRNIYLRADKDIPYGVVINIMSSIKNAGIKNIGLMTLPNEKGT